MSIKRTTRRILTYVLALALLAVFPAVAYATGISVSADSTSVKVGDTVTVTVTVTAPHIAVADGVFTYDPALLSYVSSNGGASDGYINLVSLQEGGSSSMTALIKFVAIGNGEAIIDVSMESVLNYDEDTLEDAQAGVSITVAPLGTGSTGETGGQTAPVVDMSITGIAANNVLGASEQMYVWPSLRTVSLPSGFTDRQVTYNNEYVGGAAIPDNEDLILLYLSNQNGENAGYYIYDAQNDVLFPYLTVTSISAKFTLIWPSEGADVPSGFVQATLVINELEMLAWTRPGDETVYLVYARSGSGEVGFYLYNTLDRSLQRYSALYDAGPMPVATPQTTEPAAPTATPVIAPIEQEQAKDGVTIDPTILIIIIAAGCLFAAAAVVFALLYIRSEARQKKKPRKGIHIKQADL